MEDLRGLLQAAEVDMTLFFRALADVDPAAPALAPLERRLLRRCETAGCRGRVPRVAGPLRRARGAPTRCRRRIGARACTRANPRYVLRNYLAQQAIDRAEQGDYAGIHELLDVLRRPYDDQPGREAFAARRPDWARDRAGCSMLSCSS